MAETIGRAVEWGPQERLGAVEEHDGVVTRDVKRCRLVELDALGGDIRCDAGVGEEW